MPCCASMTTPDDTRATATEMWRERFELVADAHASVTTLEEPDAEDTLALARSLAVFQIGESGSGEHLFAAAEAADVDDDYMAALRAFVREEQEHARLLAVVLDAMDHPLRTSHWSDRVFVLLRRLRSLRTEVLTLLVAEVIALTYYGMLRDSVYSRPLSDVFARIHRDEERHVAFHAATLPAHLRQFSPSTLIIVRSLWSLLVMGSAVMVAIDHRHARRHAGVGFVTFLCRVNADRARLADALWASSE